MRKLSESKYHSWIKAGLAVLYTKEGIEPFVYDEMQNFQWKCLSDICFNNRLMSGTACSMCYTENVVVCPTNRICNARHGRCDFHRNTATRYNPAGCPNRICHNFKTEIHNAHRYNGPSYRNTDATQWCSNPWEVAKCFMPPDGYKVVTSATGTDFNGINSVIINYKGFQAKVNDNLGNKNNIFEKARIISREVRHAPNLEVDDVVLQQYFMDLQTLLSDLGYLATNKDAQNAKRKLTQLQNDTLVIGKDDVRKVLVDVVKAVQDKIRTEIDEQKKEAEKQKLDLLNTSLASINEIKNQENVSVAELKDVLSFSLNRIKEKTEESIKTFETKTDEGIGKIEHETQESIKTLETKKNEGTQKIEHDTQESIIMLNTKTDEGVEQIQEETRSSKRKVEDEGSEQEKRLQTVSEKEQNILKETAKKTEGEICNSLQEDLIQLYRTQYSTLPITPLLDGIIDVPLLEMYVPPFPMASVETDNLKRISEQPRERPKMERRPAKQAREEQKVDDMSNTKCETLSDVFYKNHKSCKNIYITAEPGFGKSSFVKWLVLTWCQSGMPSTEIEECFSDTDLQQMREFEFVFLVLLRDTQPEETRVDKMLANHLISLLGRQAMYKEEVVENILSTRKCLIILDGLDEWNSSNDPSGLPHRAARDTCTYITTSRPWKMATVSVKSSQVDQHIEIKDLKSICTYEILPKILNIFENKNCLRNDCLQVRNRNASYSFLQMLKDKNLEHFAASPVMLMQILYLWNFDKTVGNSQCQIYSNIVDALLARAVEKGTVPLLSKYKNIVSSKLYYFEDETCNCETYYKLLHDLGQLAFQTLFSDQKESSLVFQGKTIKQYIQTGNNDEFLDTVVKVGLLSQEMHMTPRKKEYSYSFYHKTIHEYFAALYIQSVPGDQHVKEKIKTRCNTVLSILEMGTVFMFVSGFNPEVAFEVLQSLQSTINDSQEMEANRRKENNYGILLSVQNMILNCVEECKSNGHELLVPETNKNAMQFPLYDIIIVLPVSESSLNYIINCNGSRIKSLSIKFYNPRENTDLSGSLTYSNLQRLEYLRVEDCKELPLFDSLDRLFHLKYIDLRGIDLGERLVLGPDIKHIEYVRLFRLSITRTAFHVLVDTVLQCDHSVKVVLGLITVEDRTSVKQEETVKHDSPTILTPRGSSMEKDDKSVYGWKKFKYYGVTISSWTLQEFVYTVEKCPNPVKVTLNEMRVSKPNTDHASKTDNEKLDTNCKYHEECYYPSSVFCQPLLSEGNQKMRDYINSSSSLKVFDESSEEIVFTNNYTPVNSDGSEKKRIFRIGYLKNTQLC